MNLPDTLLVDLRYSNLDKATPERLLELATWLRGHAALVEGQASGHLIKRDQHTFFNT